MLRLHGVYLTKLSRVCIITVLYCNISWYVISWDDVRHTWW